MCTDVLTACKSGYHIHAGLEKGQKRMLNPLEPELQMVISRNAGAGIRTQILCESRSSQCSSLLSHLTLAPFWAFFLSLPLYDLYSVTLGRLQAGIFMTRDLHGSVRLAGF